MNVAAVSPVASELFEYVVEEAARLEQEKSAIGKHLDSDSPIIVFCENFFLQFFENVVGYTITGVDPENKERAARQRRKQPRAAGAVRRLISQFERLCEVYPDLFGSGPADDVRDFHEQYVPRLLDRIAEWADDAGMPPLLAAANNARDTYRNVVAS